MCIRDRGIAVGLLLNGRITLDTCTQRAIVTEREEEMGNACFGGDMPVSYTHLDVYKRQDKRNSLEVKIEELERKEARMVLDGANLDDVHGQLAKEGEVLVLSLIHILSDLIDEKTLRWLELSEIESN